MEGWELPSRLVTDPNQDAGWIDTCLTDDRFLELQQEKRGAVHPPAGHDEYCCASHVAIRFRPPAVSLLEFRPCFCPLAAKSRPSCRHGANLDHRRSIHLRGLLRHDAGALA